MGAATHWLLTESQLAEKLQLSPDTLRRMRARREIPFVQISSRRVAYRPEAIESWLKERSVEAEANRSDDADEIMAELLGRSIT